MTPEKIYQLGEGIQNVSGDVDISGELALIGVLAFLLFAGIFGASLIEHDEFGIGGAIMMLVFVVFGGSIFAVGMSITDKQEKADEAAYELALSEWENDYVLPYIKSLPVEKYDVTTLSDANIGRCDRMFSRKVDELHRVMVYYIENTNEMQLRSCVEIKRDVAEGEKPYIEYQTVAKDLGNYWQAGRYNPVLHIHASGIQLYDKRFEK